MRNVKVDEIRFEQAIKYPTGVVDCKKQVWKNVSADQMFIKSPQKLTGTTVPPAIRPAKPLPARAIKPKP